MLMKPISDPRRDVALPLRLTAWLLGTCSGVRGVS